MYIEFLMLTKINSDIIINDSSVKDNVHHTIKMICMYADDGSPKVQ